MDSDRFGESREELSVQCATLPFIRDIIFVAHPDPATNQSAWWGVCRTCGNMDVVEGTRLGAGDEHNKPLMARWIETHVCKETPDYFALSEYGEINAYYGLDPDAL